MSSVLAHVDVADAADLLSPHIPAHDGDSRHWGLLEHTSLGEVKGLLHLHGCIRRQLDVPADCPQGTIQGERPLRQLQRQQMMQQDKAIKLNQSLDVRLRLQCNRQQARIWPCRKQQATKQRAQH